MRKEENSPDLSTHFSDVWAEGQRLRSIIFRSLVLKACRRIFFGRPLAATNPAAKPANTSEHRS